MAVPGHDERDWEFAKKFNLPIKEVVEGGNIEEGAYTGDGVHINSGFLDGLNNEKAIQKMIEWLEENGAGKEKSNTNCAIGCSAANVIGANRFQSSIGKTVR